MKEKGEKEDKEFGCGRLNKKSLTHSCPHAPYTDHGPMELPNLEALSYDQELIMGQWQVIHRHKR